MIENTNLKNDMAHPFSRRNMIMPPATVEDAADAEGKQIGPAATVSNVECKSFKGAAVNYIVDDCVGANYADFDGITAGTEYVDDYGVTWCDVTNQSVDAPSGSISYLPVMVWDTENFVPSTEQVPLDHGVASNAYVRLTASTYIAPLDKLDINSYMLFDVGSTDPFDLYVINGYRFQIFGTGSKGYIKVLKVNPEDHEEIIDEVASVQILDQSQSHTMMSAAGSAVKFPITAGAGCYMVTFVTEDASSSLMCAGGLIVAPQKNTAITEVTLSSGEKSDHEVEIV